MKAITIRQPWTQLPFDEAPTTMTDLFVQEPGTVSQPSRPTVRADCFFCRRPRRLELLFDNHYRCRTCNGGLVLTGEPTTNQRK